MRSLQDYAATYAMENEERIPIGNSIIGAAAIVQIYEDYCNSIKIIGREIQDEAEKREWCEEYEWFMERLDNMLPNPMGTMQDRKIRVTFTVRFDLTLKNVRPTRDDMSAFEHHLSRTDASGYDIARALFNEAPEPAEWVGYEYEVDSFG